jgi:hypothetical protein
VFADEPFGVAGVGGGEHVGAGVAHGLGLSIVDVDGVVVADTAVVVLGVVPGEEALAERPRLLDGAEGVGEVGPVLERLELGLAVGVVVAGVRPGVRLGKAPG